VNSYAITTLGCKVNQYDAQAMATLLRRRGLVPAEATRPVDLLIVNTCCVTTAAMRKSRQAIRQAVRRSPGAAVLVAGCYTDYDASRISQLLRDLGIQPCRAVIAGHHTDLANEVNKAVEALEATGGPPAPARPSQPAGEIDAPGNEVFMRAGSPIDASLSPTFMKTRRKAAVKENVPGTQRLGPIDRFAGNQRAFVKVQDGCDAFCSYCVVPYTRCRVWSRSIDDVEAECRVLVAAGHKEIVLAGVFLGAFGRRTAIRRRWNGRPAMLEKLLARIAGIEGLWRVRLSSLEPGDVSDELLGLCRENPTVAPHFHLPLQSGSRRILERMNRQYTPDQFRRTIGRLRASLDRPAITTDIIVGFPGETEDDFAKTLAMARHAGFAKIHAFPFSAIEPTAAWTWRHEAPAPPVVKERLARLGELEADLAGAYRQQFVGQTLEGLVERARSPHSQTRQAMTDRYLTVRFGPPADADLTGQVVTLRIEHATSHDLTGWSS